MGNASSKSQRYMEQRERINTEHRKSGKLAMNLVREEFNRDIQEVYDLRSGALLGKGGFGTVRVVTHKETRKKFALKTIELKDVETHEQYEFLLNEIEIMKKLDHPNIARVQEVFHTPDHYYMVMDLYTGGDMYARYKFRSEADTAKIVGKLINALRYCHDRNVAHRDIKLENICFESEAEDAEVKLVDFGLSASFKEEQLRHDLVGSWAFMAPEVLQRAHHPQACDMWSMGVISYCLLAGYPPFRSVNLKGLKEQILHNKVLFEGDAWRSVSHVAKDFINRLLKKDPSKRLTAQQAQQHPWLQTRKKIRESQLSPEVVGNLMRFKNLHLMKRLALGVVARTLEASDMRNLEQEFHKADVEEKGVLSIEDFRAVFLRSGQFQAKDVDDIFSLVDIDNSGELSYTDFTAAALSLHQLDTRRLKYAFERLDNDNNGEIDYEDLLMIVGSDLSSEEIRIAIKQFDTKGNGRVTFEDFCKGMRSAGGGGALDALATAQLTSRYMVDSIKNGKGQAAIKTALTEIELCSSDMLPGIPEPGERGLGVSAPGEAAAAGPSVATSLYHDIGASVSSSAGTAELSRTQSLENESGNFSRSHAPGVLGAADAGGGGGIEAAPPPQPGSEGRPAAGGARVDAGPAGADPASTTPTIIIPPGDAWGETLGGSLADRRMRDSIKIRAIHGGVVPGPLGFATSSSVRSTPLTSAAVDAAAAGSAGVATPRHTGVSLAGSGVRGAKGAGGLLPPKPSKAGTPTARVGARGNGQAPLPPQHEQHLPAPASARSGGDPAAGGQAGGNADRNGKNVKKRVIEPAADLPPKDSTADPADLGWGPDGPPADLMGPIGDSTEGSSTGTARGGLRKHGASRNSGSPKSLKFGDVSDDSLPSRGKAKGDKRKGLGNGGVAGAHPRRTGGVGVHGGYGAGGQGMYGRRDSDDTCCGPENGALFCVPGDGSGRRPPWVEWVERVLRGGPGPRDHAGH